MKQNGEESFLNWVATTNYDLMLWVDSYWWPIWIYIFFTAGLFSMSPLKTHHEHTFHEVVLIKHRIFLLLISFFLVITPLVNSYLYDITGGRNNAESNEEFLTWFLGLLSEGWHWIPIAFFSGFVIKLLSERYLIPLLSKLLRSIRFKQTNETSSDIRNESSTYQAKDFNPLDKYCADNIIVGVNKNNETIKIPLSTWRETNMQVIGPTRYGKGVILGLLMDQVIKLNDGLIYIDPKNDKFAPHIMKQACDEVGRKFYYLTLSDDGMGSWSPFVGGSERDAISRIEYAFDLEMSGDPGTDFYKSQEKRQLLRAFVQTKHIRKLENLLSESEANRVVAELESWSRIKSLCPEKGRGFSIEKALLENAVVYVQGSLNDAVIKKATKVFIIEVIQEAMRLKKERKNHLTFIIDEVRFLVSTKLADALSTAVGAQVNIVTAYQSIGDLLTPDDKTINGRALLQSVNVNSQIKAVYGGSDFETADWAQKTSGSIQKSVTKFEKTNITATGGETWEKSRMIGMQEEQLLHANVLLSLPPRVCAFFQPSKLAEICFTSFIAVKDNEVLENYIEMKTVKNVGNEDKKNKNSARRKEQKENKKAAEILSKPPLPAKPKTSATTQNDHDSRHNSNSHDSVALIDKLMSDD